MSNETKWTAPQGSEAVPEVRVMAGEELVAIVYSTDAHSCDENRRLIAAAPDLYSALESARVALADSFTHPPPHVALALVHVEAALRRARGEE